VQINERYTVGTSNNMYTHSNVEKIKNRFFETP